MTKKGRKMITCWEGLVLRIYLDKYANPTGGWGHKLSKEEQAQYPVGTPISQELADEWFERDSAWVDKAIDRFVRVSLNENQKAALECLVFNTGEGVLHGTAPKLMGFLNAGDFEHAADEFLDICHAVDIRTGKRYRDEGLANRRKAERAVFVTPVANDMFDPERFLTGIGLSIDMVRNDVAAGWFHDRTEEPLEADA